MAHVSRDRVEFIDSSGLALGMFCAADYGRRRIQLAPGDFLVLYTDGLTEARDPADEEYGTERLAARLAGLATQSGMRAQDLAAGDVKAGRLHTHAAFG